MPNFSAGLLLLTAALPAASASVPKWLDVPYVRQVTQGCGSAAVAMIIQYWARLNPSLDAAAADTERIDQALPPRSPQGIEGKALQQYLEARGFHAFVFGGELGDLEHHLRKGRPVIVCLGPKGSRGPLHYAVVAGIDGLTVWLNDPARGKLTREDLASFVASWKATGNWALLAVPKPNP